MSLQTGPGCQWGGGSGRTLTNLAAKPAYAGNSVINIDCNNCVAGTLVKVTQQLNYADALVYSAEGGGQLQAAECPGMCLSATSSTPHKAPCKEGEWGTPGQVVLVSCSDPAAGGWSI